MDIERIKFFLTEIFLSATKEYYDTDGWLELDGTIINQIRICDFDTFVYYMWETYSSYKWNNTEEPKWLQIIKEEYIPSAVDMLHPYELIELMDQDIEEYEFSYSVVYNRIVCCVIENGLNYLCPFSTYDEFEKEKYSTEYPIINKILPYITKDELDFRSPIIYYEFDMEEFDPDYWFIHYGILPYSQEDMYEYGLEFDYDEKMIMIGHEEWASHNTEAISNVGYIG